MVPQGYVSYYTATRACENAGKRLCTNDEWLTACKGQQQTKHPYGQIFSRGPCNVYRFLHPASILHGLASSGHLDPRLNLLMIAGDAPVLRLTGESQACASRWGDDAIYDMVGNLDEWVEAPKGVFRGGFYARATTKGCESEVTNHSKLYFDYSTGARCCMAAR
jgi:formylglycine-generating enzyme required for sulfatase activity